VSLKKLLNKTKYLSSEDLELVKHAYRFAEMAHRGQKRLSGDPYITHPIEVACFLADLKLDGVTLASTLVHDVLEDTDITLEDIERQFSSFSKKTGKKIAQLVDGVSKLGEIRYYGEKGEIENFRKMILAMACDMRVVLIRLADRLHNVKTLAFLPAKKQKRIAQQTIEIYAPLADRLGMGEIKGQLEDFAFKYYLPKEYNWTRKLAEKRFDEREKYVQKVKKVLLQKLKKAAISPLKIEGRAKHLYSLYKKLKKYDNDINKIYDLVAVRIIVSSVEECYGSLGVIHADFKPLLGRIKDYISMPKPNGYRSLHTTVFCVDGKVIEIQIKTPKMHQEAEWGIAAHFFYAEQKESLPLPKEKIAWAKQLAEWQRELASSKEFAESLKIDIFQDRIFVFTPRGDIKDLPEGATPVDFAYAVHSEIGEKCIGAKANGKIVPLHQELKNGDMVEILTSKLPQGPRRDWLNFVKTNLARSRIKNWFRKKDGIATRIKH
jgi:GTP pyrophosphokinase